MLQSKALFTFCFPVYNTAETVVKNITINESEQETEDTLDFKASLQPKANKGAGEFKKNSNYSGTKTPIYSKYKHADRVLETISEWLSLCKSTDFLEITVIACKRKKNLFLRRILQSRYFSILIPI